MVTSWIEKWEKAVIIVTVFFISLYHLCPGGAYCKISKGGGLLPPNRCNRNDIMLCTGRDTLLYSAPVEILCARRFFDRPRAVPEKHCRARALADHQSYRALMAASTNSLWSFVNLEGRKKNPRLHWSWGFLVRPERFELPTYWFVARHSIQLSYGRIRMALPSQRITL